MRNSVEEKIHPKCLLHQYRNYFNFENQCNFPLRLTFWVKDYIICMHLSTTGSNKSNKFLVILFLNPCSHFPRKGRESCLLLLTCPIFPQLVTLVFSPLISSINSVDSCLMLTGLDVIISMWAINSYKERKKNMLQVWQLIHLIPFQHKKKIPIKKKDMLLFMEMVLFSKKCSGGMVKYSIHWERRDLYKHGIC